jgi:hypothetical protein
MEQLGSVSDGITLTAVAIAKAKMSGGGDVKEPLTANQKLKYTGSNQNSGVDPVV